MRRDGGGSGVVGGGGVVRFFLRFPAMLHHIMRARQRDRSAGNYWREPTDFLALTKLC